MQRAARLLALLSLFGLVLVSPAGAVCPANTLYANGTTTQSTNPTASLSRTVGCYPYGDASGSASYNLRLGQFSAHSNSGGDCGSRASCSTLDVFTLIGPASTDSIPFTAQLNVSISWSSSVSRFYGGGDVSLTEGTSNSKSVGGSGNNGSKNATLAVTIKRLVGETFNLGVYVSASDGSFASGSASASLSFTGLPSGYAVVSCQGYVSDPAVPVHATSWGRLKAIYR